MLTTGTKPKLAFFQYKYDSLLPEFLLHQKDEHVKCVAQFFDVVVINHDCDYQQICDSIRQVLTVGAKWSDQTPQYREHSWQSLSRCMNAAVVIRPVR